VQYEGADPLSFVVSRNLCRRHLSESQRSMVAAAIIELQRDDDGRSAVTVADAAKQLNVSERMVYHATKILHEGTEQDVKDIMSGEKRVRAVADEIAETDNFSLSSELPDKPDREQIAILKENVLAAARTLRKNMDDLFVLTMWSDTYKRLHRNLRTIIFDE